MEENKNTIFREKSLERVTSPEKLDAYLKVTTPKVWMLLSAIIVILIGVIVWGYFGRLETTRSGACSISNKTATCIIQDNNIDTIKKGMEIRIDDNSYTVSSVDYDLNENDVNAESFNLTVIAPVDLADGLYKGKVIIESISPLKFVFN